METRSIQLVRSLQLGLVAGAFITSYFLFSYRRDIYLYQFVVMGLSWIWSGYCLFVTFESARLFRRVNGNKLRMAILTIIDAVFTILVLVAGGMSLGMYVTAPQIPGLCADIPNECKCQVIYSLFSIPVGLLYVTSTLDSMNGWVKPLD